MQWGISYAFSVVLLPARYHNLILPLLCQLFELVILHFILYLSWSSVLTMLLHYKGDWLTWTLPCQIHLSCFYTREHILDPGFNHVFLVPFQYSVIDSKLESSRDKSATVALFSHLPKLSCSIWSFSTCFSLAFLLSYHCFQNWSQHSSHWASTQLLIFLTLSSCCIFILL